MPLLFVSNNVSLNRPSQGLLWLVVLFLTECAWSTVLIINQINELLMENILVIMLVLSLLYVYRFGLANHKSFFSIKQDDSWVWGHTQLQFGIPNLKTWYITNQLSPTHEAHTGYKVVDLLEKALESAMMREKKQAREGAWTKWKRKNRGNEIRKNKCEIGIIKRTEQCTQTVGKQAE